MTLQNHNGEKSVLQNKLKYFFMLKSIFIVILFAIMAITSLLSGLAAQTESQHKIQELTELTCEPLLVVKQIVEHQEEAKHFLEYKNSYIRNNHYFVTLINLVSREEITYDNVVLYYYYEFEKRAKEKLSN